VSEQCVKIAVSYGVMRGSQLVHLFGVRPANRDYFGAWNCGYGAGVRIADIAATDQAYAHSHYLVS
jgi:hypothetical protein